MSRAEERCREMKSAAGAAAGAGSPCPQVVGCALLAVGRKWLPFVSNERPGLGRPRACSDLWNVLFKRLPWLQVGKE